jgi:flagellar basal body-associated protein FliL
MEESTKKEKGVSWIIVLMAIVLAAFLTFLIFTSF